jgi:hypothetical protein
MFAEDKAYGQLYSRGFKKYYKGKPTKQYARLIKVLKQAEGTSEQDIMRSMITT